MAEEWCEKCGKLLASERARRVELCPRCEFIESRKKLDDVGEFVASQPMLFYEDGLTYVIEPQPEFDD